MPIKPQPRARIMGLCLTTQIIQAASARPYEDVIRSQIFIPLQMNHSGAAPDDAAVREAASGYRHWLG